MRSSGQAGDLLFTLLTPSLDAARMARKPWPQAAEPQQQHQMWSSSSCVTAALWDTTIQQCIFCFSPANLHADLVCNEKLIRQNYQNCGGLCFISKSSMRKLLPYCSYDVWVLSKPSPSLRSRVSVWMFARCTSQIQVLGCSDFPELGKIFSSFCILQNHRIIESLWLEEHLVQPQPTPPYLLTSSLSAVSPWFCDTSMDSDSSTSLGSCATASVLLLRINISYCPTWTSPATT